MTAKLLQESKHIAWNICMENTYKDFKQPANNAANNAALFADSLQTML